MGFDLSKNDNFAKDLYQYFTGAETSRNRQVLMHNRMGIRIEFDVDLCNLVLWTSPNAGETLSYKDRNFSCRDDNTALFDVIHFLSLMPEQFDGCDYGPFCSVIKYKDGTRVELLSLVDQPAILVRINNNAVINFKSDKQDVPVAKEQRLFSVEHPDRGYRFVFSAALNEGSEFVHPSACDSGRSIYAQAKTGANGFVVLTSGLMDDVNGEKSAKALAERLAAQSFDDIKEENEAKAEEICSFGNIELNKCAAPDIEKLENLLKINKDILVSAQDASGAIQAALKRIYYLIWNRDGGMIWALSSYAGLTWPLEKWTEFLLANPLEIDEGGWKGRTFAQMVNGKISKWQEDGTFYAVWAAFTHWTQTGDDKFIQPEILSVLEESVDWMERYCFDSELGLYGRYFYCETPLTGARDNGWDNAVGKPGNPRDTFYEGENIVRAYDIYVNAIMHSVFMMLGAMERKNMPEKADENLKKAAALDEKMSSMFDGEGLPLYGYLKTTEGKLVEAGPYGMDPCDYEWALAIAQFLRNPLEMKKYRSLMYKDLMGERRGGFVAAYASVLSGMDTEFVSEQQIMDAVNYVAEQSYRPGDCLVMPNTIVEIIDVNDGNIFHDVRPQMFSISAMLAAVSNLAVKKLPFGLAIRASNMIKSVRKYEYLGGVIDFIYENAVDADSNSNAESAENKKYVKQVEIDGKVLRHTLQLPVDLLNNEKTTVKTILSSKPEIDNVLIYSSVKLLSVDEAEAEITYHCEGYGNNDLMFRGMTGKVEVMDESGNQVEYVVENADAYTLVSFKGVGKFDIKVF